ncbi:unnamed protein product, partial [Didymodactylos carnosus]
MRLIVSMRETIGSNLARYISQVLKPIGDNARSIINTGDFIKKLNKIKISNRTTLCSLDVVDLFTSIDRKHALSVLKDEMEKNDKWKGNTDLKGDSIIKIVDFCIENVIFQFGDYFYSQVTGLPMGSSLSPLLADICMNEFLITHWDDGKYPYQLRGRYVDDIILISEMNKDMIQNLKTHLNNID